MKSVPKETWSLARPGKSAFVAETMIFLSRRLRSAYTPSYQDVLDNPMSQLTKPAVNPDQRLIQVQKDHWRKFHIHPYGRGKSESNPRCNPCEAVLRYAIVFAEAEPVGARQFTVTSEASWDCIVSVQLYSEICAQPLVMRDDEALPCTFKGLHTQAIHQG